MPLIVAFENPEVVDAIQGRIDGMIEHVAGLRQEVPAEFITWQTDDMHRRYPNLEESGEDWLHAWMTRIWPRARGRAINKKFARRRGTPIKRNKSVFSMRPVVTSGRPILRDELFDMLRARMRKLLDRISWKPV